MVERGKKLVSRDCFRVCSGGRPRKYVTSVVVALNNVLVGVENFVKVLSWRIGEVISDEEFSQLYSAWLPLADTEVRSSVLTCVSNNN